jgi:prepilin-type processing-associated H-X9-DG protein
MAETNVSLTTSHRRPTGRVILAAIASIILVGGVVVLQSVRTAWGRMVRLDCQSNLRQLGLRCREYAAEHNGHFPSAWVELNFVGDDTNGAKLLRCPQTDHEIGAWTQVDLWADYRLLSGRTTNDPSDRILALEPLGNHGSAGANVLFVDGGTQWWPLSRLLRPSLKASTRTKSAK